MDASPTTPADRFISRFGVEALARWTGRHRSRVHAWTWPTSKGGTGGVVPARARAAIIAGAATDLKQTVAYADFEPAAGETYLMDAGGEGVQ